ncbi:hypothetical protein J3A83DRAFT_4193260 [Scleroderma citrinum]
MEIKYTANGQADKALQAIADAAWFMFDQQDTRCYILAASLCGSLLTVCLLNHGGNVTTVELDIECNLIYLLEYLVTMVIGDMEILGFEKMRDCYMWLAFGGFYQFTLLARVFRQQALIGRSTKVFIAHMDAPTGISATAALSQLVSLCHCTHHDSSITFMGSAGTLGAVPRISSPIPIPSISKTSQWASPYMTSNSPSSLLLPHHSSKHQLAIKDCWALPDLLPKGYCLDHLAGKEGAADRTFTFKYGFPTQVYEEFLKVYDPVQQEIINDITRLHHQHEGPIVVLPNFKHCIHYCIVFEEVIVTLPWFLMRREFLLMIIKALEAHQFTIHNRKILHCDISPWNIWIYITTWSPKPRDSILRDWGLATMLEGFKELMHPQAV